MDTRSQAREQSREAPHAWKAPLSQRCRPPILQRLNTAAAALRLETVPAPGMLLHLKLRLCNFLQSCARMARDEMKASRKEARVRVTRAVALKSSRRPDPMPGRAVSRRPLCFSSAACPPLHLEEQQARGDELGQLRVGRDAVECAVLLHCLARGVELEMQFKYKNKLKA